MFFLLFKNIIFVIRNVVDLFPIDIIFLLMFDGIIIVVWVFGLTHTDILL